MLASASPRRRTLLAEAGLSFEIEVANVDEDLVGSLEPEEAAVELGLRKARAVAGRHAGDGRLVIGADTIVATGPEGSGRLLGKPADADEARAMLSSLSGTRHRVVTGVAVIRTRDGREVSAFERTWVTMRTLSPEEVETYVASGEWRDKAGGYAIQENADAFVTGLEEGGFDNVVGLPVALTRKLLAELAG